MPTGMYVYQMSMLTGMQTCKHAHACMHACMYEYIQTCIHSYMHVYINAYNHVYMKGYTTTAGPCVYMYMYKYIVNMCVQKWGEYPPRDLAPLLLITQTSANWSTHMHSCHRSIKIASSGACALILPCWSRDVRASSSVRLPALFD